MFGKQDELEFILKWIFTCTHIPSQKEVERLITFFRQKKRTLSRKIEKKKKTKGKNHTLHTKCWILRYRYFTNIKIRKPTHNRVDSVVSFTLFINSSLSYWLCFVLLLSRLSNEVAMMRFEDEDDVGNTGRKIDGFAVISWEIAESEALVVIAER